MATGLLEVRGTIELDPFWPRGDSDADTTKIVVRVGPDSFRFRPHEGARFQVTHGARSSPAACASRPSGPAARWWCASRASTPRSSTIAPARACRACARRQLHPPFNDNYISPSS
ncbi:MAG: hypothetical protein WKG00_40235, partial [Polyangiaceae bacterium]